MPTPIKITIEGVVLTGELFDNQAAKALADSLPFQVSLNRWGEEFYGKPDKEIGKFGGQTQEVMEVGDLAYHDDTGWFCIFWGPTPSSQGDESRAAFPVQKVGEVSGDWSTLSGLAESVIALVEADQA